MNLAFDHHWVDPRAAIIWRTKAADFRNTGVHVYIHNADIRAKWIGHVGRIIVTDRFKPGLQPRNGLFVGGISDFSHRLEPLGRTFDNKPVYVEFDVVIVDF